MIVGVLGSSGFLGTNLMKVLENEGVTAIYGSRNDPHWRSRVHADDAKSVENWIDNNEITHVVNLAAICGGIGLNKKHPYMLWSATTRITANVLDACIHSKVKKVVMIGTVCSYAADCPIPFKESDLMDHGMPEVTNMAYGMSKLNGLIGGQVATKECGLNVVNLIPVNMYGPHDHFDLENSHVIPAMINKIIAAMEAGEKDIEVWGDGSPTREFLYAEDCADAICRALQDDVSTTEMINVGTGVEITIKELVETICDILEFDGNIIWNKDKPNGQMRRCLDTSKSKKLLNWSHKTNFKEGLRNTITWYKSQK